MVDEDSVKALRDHALSVPPASSTDAALPAPLSRSLDDARIVGLGEATHGSRECFEHKRRLIQHLVTERDFRTVAFEADAAAVTALEAFVRDGTAVEAPDDAESALAELDMWQWRTESVRALLDWLREFNSGRSPEEQVRIRGMDLSTPSAPAAPLRSYLDAAGSTATEDELLRTISDATVPDDADERDRVLDEVATAADDLAGRLTANRPVDDTPATDVWHTARHLCRVVEQACEWARVRHEQPGPHPDGMATRDRFMAENARWALERDPGEGVVLWAHDAHVQRGTFDDGTIWADATTMGGRLARDLGDGYRPVGFDFARGSFRAVAADSGEVGTFAVGDPIDGTATAAFTKVKGTPYALDLQAAADDDPLDAWLGTGRRTRYVGSVFDPDGGDEESYGRTDLPASFDWLVVLPASSPSRPVDDA